VAAVGSATLRIVDAGSPNATSSFSLKTDNKDVKDIVTDGNYLWVVNDSNTDKVFKYTVADTHVGNWTISTSGAGSPTGIRLDPVNVSTIWIVDNGTDRMYQYDAVAGLTSGSNSANSSFALSAGNTNPQDIADPPPPGDSVRMLSAVIAPPAASDAMAPIANSKPSDIALIQLSDDVVHTRVGKPIELDRADSDPSLAPQLRNNVIAFSTQKSMKPTTTINRN